MFSKKTQIKASDDTEPVALVDGAAVTRKVLEREVRKARDQYAMQGTFPDEARLTALGQEVLERLIETELLWQQSVREGIEVTEEAVAGKLAEMQKYYINKDIFNNA